MTSGFSIRQLFWVLLAVLMTGRVCGQETARVMLIAGQNNHDWKKANPYLEHILNSHERIECTTCNAPSSGNEQDWAQWDPVFDDYHAVVLNYNGREWPSEIKSRFINYVRGGGGVILIHAANNGFRGWSEFEEMVGLLWRSPDYGTAIYLDESGDQVRLAPGKGGGMGHGGVYDWVMTTRDHQNPVTKGLPRHWMHARDELYHGQRGPANNINILLSAYSDPKHGGTGRHEPIVWWTPYRRGKVMTNLMGHVWQGGETDCLQCVGFQIVLQRSVLWLAGMPVDLETPPNFPLADQTSKVSISPELLAKIEEMRIPRVGGPFNVREGGLNELTPGLKYAVFDGTWSEIPDFAGLTPQSTGTTDEVTLSVSQKTDRYALQFKGYLWIQDEGDVTFYTRSDDGSKLLLSGVTVVDNDGTHGEEEQAARVHLSPGVYPIEVQYFEASGGQSLDVTYVDSSGERQPLKSEILFHEK